MGKRNSSSSSLQTPPPSRPDNSDSKNLRQLAVVTTPTTNRLRFTLPAGWGVEEVPRSNGYRIDRYYYEPGTGQKFRSLKDVERHLNGDVPLRSRSERTPTLANRSKNSPPRKMIAHGGKMLKLDDEEELNPNQWAIVPSEPNQLPDGWIVEEVPRKYANFSDKYYYEPGTGRKFRSRVAVERHLAEMSEDKPLSEALEELNENKPLSKMFKLHNNTTNSGSWKKKRTPREGSTVKPPSKVNWVLASSRGDAWNPFIGDQLVSDPVKQQWGKRFMAAMNNDSSSPEQ